MEMDKEQISQQTSAPEADQTSNSGTSTAGMDTQMTDQSSVGALENNGTQIAAQTDVSSTTGLGLLDSTAASLRSEPLKEKNEQAKNVIAHRMLWGQHEKMHNSVTVKQDGTMDFNDDVDEWF